MLLCVSMLFPASALIVRSTTTADTDLTRPYCTIDIRDSTKDYVLWDIADADADVVRFYCERDTYHMVFGGEI